MNKKQFDALVNKGAITHVGIAAGIDKMTDEEICKRYVTMHEVAAEVLDEDIVDEPVKVPVTINVTSEGTPKVGEIVTTKVSLNPGDYAGTMIRVRSTVNPAGATKLKYKEGDVWLDLPVEGSEDGVFYFGASVGFPLDAEAVSEFHTECVVAGPVTTTLDIIEVATGEVIGSDSQTIEILPADEVVTPEVTDAPEAVAEPVAVEAPAKKSSKKSKKTEDAPVVDPVE